MAKHDISDSEQEETPENSSSSESEDAGKASNGAKSRAVPVSEYEKQRLSRIAENRARMEALGLPKIASSVMGSGQNAKIKNQKKGQKGKGKLFEDDEDYRPEEEGPSSSSEAIEEDDDDDDYSVKRSSGSRKKKNKGSKPKKVLPRSTLSNEDNVNEDEALKEAIALSLRDPIEASGVVHSQFSQSSNVINANVNERKGNTRTPEDEGKRKRKKSFTSRVQMTEDELILHFFQFDENCNGGISFRDLQRVATTHDFMWTDKELADMIRCFDVDGDGKLNLDEFRKIVVRCNMIKEPEQP